MKKKKKQNDCIDELLDWQENMYNPGHYIGQARSFNTRRLATKSLYLSIAFYLVPAVISLIIAVWIYKDFINYQDYDALIIGTFFLITSILGLAAGYRIIKSYNNKKKAKNIKYLGKK